MAKSYLDYDGLAYVFSKIKALIYKALGVQGVTTEGAGDAYTASVPGISELTAGATFMMVPHVVSTVVNPTLNVNGLGAKYIRRRVSNSTITTVPASSANWLGAGKPIRVTFDGTYWIADNTRPNANDIYGTVAVDNGGTGASTAEGARANLGAVSMEDETVILTAEGWENNQQTVSASHVTVKSTVFISPVPDAENFAAYTENGVRCIGKADGELTFVCDFVPDIAVTVNVSACA